MLRVSALLRLAAALAVLATVGFPTASGALGGPFAPQAAFAPRGAFDFNPDPDVVEVVLVAHPGRFSFGTGNRTRVWMYNGGIPGPTIQGKVGDTLIVHFWNLLPEETTIHWHGMELPAAMDGSHIAQNPVPPGGYFRYEFELLRASMFWYHPHVRSNEQVEKGLYGAIVVRERPGDAPRLPRREHVLVLDDVLLGDDGQIAEPFPADPVENAAMQLNGREGNVLLVNGRPNRHAWLRRGIPHRLRLVNAANARMMRVSLSGHSMWRIGGDGGLLESPLPIEPIGMVEDPGGEHGEGHEGGHPGLVSDPDLEKGIILTPGERADVLFVPTGHEVRLEWHDYARGRHGTFATPEGGVGVTHAHDDGARPPETLMTFHLYGPPARRAYAPPAHLRDIEPIDPTGAAPLPVLFGHTPPNSDGDVTFFAQMKDGMPLPFDAVTPADAPSVTVGETRVWVVNNMTGGDHNFHSHGFGFQPIEIEYVDMDTPENNYVVPFDLLEDKDTIRIPKRPGAMGRSRTILRAVARFDDAGREGETEAFGKVPGDETSGGWLFHCHVLEHARRGMMSFLQVLNP